MRHALNLVVTATLAVAMLPAAAGEGRIPIPFQAPVTFPIVIAQPGKYVLTRNLVGPGGVAVIEIGAQGVEIDLNGMVISGGEPGISIEVVAEAVIRDGTIEAGGIGVHGVTGLNDVVIEGVHFRGQTEQAILLNDPDAYVIRRCIIEDIENLQFGQAAIHMIAAERSQGTIESNVIRRASETAVRIEGGAGVTIHDNRLKEIGREGILYLQSEAAGSAHISRNTIEGSATAIYVSGDASKVVGNLASRCANGIWIVGNGNLILDNVVHGSEFNGIRLGALNASTTANHIEGNVVTSSGTGGDGWALSFSSNASDNTFGRNTAYGSSGGVCVNPLTSEVCDGDVAPDNYSFGNNLMPPSGGLW